MRPSPENLQRWNICSDEWKRSKDGRMEQLKGMEYESRKASSDYIYIYFIMFREEITNNYIINSLKRN